MNKYIKAIDRIAFNYGISALEEQTNKIMDEKFDADISVLQELVEKATPKKPKRNEEFDIYGCPNCDFADMIWGTFKKTDCCPRCGQALDWGEDDD